MKRLIAFDEDSIEYVKSLKKGRGPTNGIKLVVEKVAEKVRKGEKISVSAIMREVGFSKYYSAQPNRMTKSKGYKEALSKVIQEKDMIELHDTICRLRYLAREIFPIDCPDAEIKYILKGTGGVVKKIEAVDIDGKECKEVWIAFLNAKMAIKGLEQYYKVTGAYAPLKIEKDDKRPYGEMTDEEIREMIKNGKKNLERIERPSPSKNPAPPLDMPNE